MQIQANSGPTCALLQSRGVSSAVLTSPMEAGDTTVTTAATADEAGGGPGHCGGGGHGVSEGVRVEAFTPSHVWA